MAVQNSLARQDQSMKLAVYLQNDAVKKQINQVVGGKNGTRFISSIVSAVQSTPALQDNNIYVRAFVYLVRVAGLIGITGILICLQIRLYRYKSALIEKEK